MSKIYIVKEKDNVIKVNCLEWDYDNKNKIVYLQVEHDEKIIVIPVVNVNKVIVA